MGFEFRIHCLKGFVFLLNLFQVGIQFFFLQLNANPVSLLLWIGIGDVEVVWLVFFVKDVGQFLL